VGRRGLYASGSGYGPVVGCCDHGYEPSGPIKDDEFPDELNDCQLFKRTLLYGVS